MFDSSVPYIDILCQFVKDGLDMLAGSTPVNNYKGLENTCGINSGYYHEAVKSTTTNLSSPMEALNSAKLPITLTDI